MAATLTLWGHALAALLFGALALAEQQREQPDWPRRALVLALTLTALWALAVAGIGPRDLSTRLVEAARNLAWLWLAATLARRITGRRATLTALYAVVGVVTVVVALMALADEPAAGTPVAAAMRSTRQVFRAMAMLGSLLLLHELALAARGRGDVRLLVLALGGMWGLDLATAALALVQGDWPAPIAAIRGAAMAGIALLIAAATQRGADGAPALSRAAAWRTIVTAAVLLYAGLTALAANAAQTAFGAHGRLAETAVVFGATAALLTLASSSWLRAWARVKIAKHLFRHRYDYRVEWQRFTATLGSPNGKGGGEAEPLPVRVVRAVADLTDSPAGLLLAADGGALTPAAVWNWPDAPDAAGGDLARYLVDSGRIVTLGALASEREAASIPPALANDPNAWIIVPLLHGEALAGVIVLAKPPVDRQLDWEDLDLLRVAGRQAASYLAEDRAHAALADAERFDEFNRRFAFILHDIKNLASQLGLVARNVERHAADPEFRADMIATLTESADRMAALIVRLSRGTTLAEPTAVVELCVLAARAVERARGPGTVELATAGPVLAVADADGLVQALGHLVRNAVEASPADRPVLVSIRAADDRAVIEVVDRGSGMSPAFIRDRLFRPFSSSKPAGFGLGAFEARQLVRAMGGALEVDSREGEGTRFRVTLPAASVLEQAA